jgi:hypothetical protein
MPAFGGKADIAFFTASGLILIHSDIGQTLKDPSELTLSRINAIESDAGGSR